MFSVPVCNIFKETMLDGQLCYQADVNKLREKVDKKKMVTEGLVFLLDYNENRMVEVGFEEDIQDDSSLLGKKEGQGDALVYIETIGNFNHKHFPKDSNWIKQDILEHMRLNRTGSSGVSQGLTGIHWV